MPLFYLYIFVFRLVCFLGVMHFSNRIAHMIFSIFGLVWFRLPLLVTKPHLTNTHSAVGVRSTIPHFILGLLPLAFSYEGTFITLELETKAVFAIFLMVRHFWIVFALCLHSRLFLCTRSCASVLFMDCVVTVSSTF
jgi:hypothetical protein